MRSETKNKGLSCFFFSTDTHVKLAEDSQTHTEIDKDTDGVSMKSQNTAGFYLFLLLSVEVL